MTERRNSRSWGRRKILLAFSVAFTSLFAWAHSPQVALANITIEDDGRFSLNLTFDLPPFICQMLPSKANDNVLNAWLDGSTNALMAGLVAAQARFQKEFTVTSDGVPGAIDTLTFPTVADVVRYRESPPTPRLPAMLMLSLEGHLPPRTSFRILSISSEARRYSWHREFTEPGAYCVAGEFRWDNLSHSSSTDRHHLKRAQQSGHNFQRSNGSRPLASCLAIPQAGF